MQKIKDALTPGHRHHDHHDQHTATGATYHGAGYNTAGYTNTTGYTDDVNVGRTAAPVQMAAGTAGMGTGLPGTGTATGLTGTHNTMSRESTYSSSSSEGGFVQHTNVAGTTCNVREFTEVEDRPVVKERVERIVEHVPVEKKFEVVTRAVGETVLHSNTTIESLGVTERVVQVAQGTTCPTVGTMERVVGAGGATTVYDKCHGGNC